MQFTFYAEPITAVHNRLSRERPICRVSDEGCEVAQSCFDCPLSRCKHDDIDWYRFWRKRVKHLLIGQEIERDGLTTEEASVRFQITDRQVFRIKRWSRRAVKRLTPDDLEVFMRLAEGSAHAGAGLRKVA